MGGQRVGEAAHPGPMHHLRRFADGTRPGWAHNQPWWTTVRPRHRTMSECGVGDNALLLGMVTRSQTDQRQARRLQRSVVANGRKMDGKLRQTILPCCRKSNRNTTPEPTRTIMTSPEPPQNLTRILPESAQKLAIICGV